MVLVCGAAVAEKVRDDGRLGVGVVCVEVKGEPDCVYRGTSRVDDGQRDAQARIGLAEVMLAGIFASGPGGGWYQGRLALFFLSAVDERNSISSDRSAIEVRACRVAASIGREANGRAWIMDRYG